jgi:hypothetical protein
VRGSAAAVGADYLLRFPAPTVITGVEILFRIGRQRIKHEEFF